MRTLEFDPEDFPDRPNGACFLRLVIAGAREHADMGGVFLAAGASRRDGEAPSTGWGGWAVVRDDLAGLVGHRLLDEARASSHVLRDEWNDVEFCTVVGSNRVLYPWWTTV